VTDSENLHPSTDDPVRREYADLVRRAAHGDAEAMEALLVRSQEVAYRVSLLVCGHPQDAEDVMQDALLKTYSHVGTIADPEAFRTWLYRTVRNACLMRRRRRVHEPKALLSIEQGAVSPDGRPAAIEVPDSAQPADRQLVNAWLGGRLREALLGLPRTLRAIVVLRDIEGLSTRDVAEITQISEANVKTRLHRARTLLRRQLGDV
jgi:RNA polymerase sigma-70 factor (ECF subfamily)